ncbi:arylesterase [Nevskia ramosa]|uniref:arylesterase n=1 Tax=Nevskia ramosa TaxID=64002 RepID=UPI003D138C5D
MLAGWLLAGGVWAAPTVLVWGDSLSAGYGVDSRQGWVDLLERKLRTQADPGLKAWNIVNASVSGETTAGGLARLPAALARHKPDVVLLELGANDGLRGLDLQQMRANLEKMTDLVLAIGAKPVIFEMRIPNNYGPVFTDRFRRAFADAAKAKQAPLMPFFLASIAEDRPRWFQDDGIHPRTEAQPQILDAVWPTLSPLLKAAASSGSSKP